MNILTLLLTALCPLMAGSCGETERTFDKVSVTITDTAVQPERWTNGDQIGCYVLGNGQPVVANINLQASCRDAAAGRFAGTFHHLRSTAAYSILCYGPYESGYENLDGKTLKVTLPPSQNEQTRPVTAGLQDFTVKGDKADIQVPMETLSGSVLVSVSAGEGPYKGWKLREVTVQAPAGVFLSGEATVSISQKRLKSLSGGSRFNTVTFKPAKAATLDGTPVEMVLQAIPATLVNCPVTILLTLTDGKAERTLCHRYAAFPTDISAGKRIVLEEHIPAVVAGDWTTADYPGTSWEEAAPESMGYSSAKFESLRQYIRNNLPTTSMMVVVGGKVIFSYGDVTENVRIASCRKSLLSTLYGRYVEDGVINLDTTVGQLGIDEDPLSGAGKDGVVPADGGVLLPIEKQATIRHLLQARSGVYHLASNDGDDHSKAPARGSQQPGTYFLYNNWDFNCAGAIFEQLTGKDIYTAFRDDIANPVGMQDYRIEIQKKTGDLTASRFPAYHFWISTRDMARFAYLMLRKGNWNGTQVVSEKWVETITSTVTPREDMNPASRRTSAFDYGYLWWIFSPAYSGYKPEVYQDGYTATGLDGQYITVLPALDMVIAHKNKYADNGVPMAKLTYYDLIAKIAACKE